MRHLLNSNQRFLLIAPFLFLLACHQTKNSESIVDPSSSSFEKSALVENLEGIFYADEFVSIPMETFRVSDYGAVGDSTSLNTKAIQDAIDAANAAGGGKVVFDPGVYLSGALFLKSNVELHIAEGVTIRAIQDDAHFPDRWTRVAGVEMDWPAALINVYQEENVRITGKGTIDGNGKYWWDKFWGDPPRTGGMWVDYTERDIRWAVDYDCKRVRAIVVFESKNVVLKDFEVLRSGFWTISLTYSNKVHVDGVTIRNNVGGFGPSSDGINTDSSSDILVENCDIDCNDDNLCIKAGRDSDGLRVNRVAENIVYRNCITRAGHGLFTIGSETSGGMRNVEVYGLKAIGTNTGIRFKSAKVRGGVIEDIWFHHIEMEEVKSPFHFELNWYPEYSYPSIPEAERTENMPRHWTVMTTRVEPEEKGIPEFKNLRFSNIKVQKAEQGIYANAYAEKPMHHLHWENIQIEANKAGVINHAANWKMDEVDLITLDNKSLQLNNAEEVELPNWRTAQENASALNADHEKKVATVQMAKDFTHLTPFNPASEQLIKANDTTAFSSPMSLYVPQIAKDEIKFFEPLGDGFYHSPITIIKTDTQIEIWGERQHDWTIVMAAPDKPKDIVGADHWEYNAEQKEVLIQKKGMQFLIEVKKG